MTSRDHHLTGSDAERCRGDIIDRPRGFVLVTATFVVAVLVPTAAAFGQTVPVTVEVPDSTSAVPPPPPSPPAPAPASPSPGAPASPDPEPEVEAPGPAPATPSGPSAPAPAPAPPPRAGAPDPSGPLPRTGSEGSRLLRDAFGALALGALLIVATRPSSSRKERP